jgi:hypothetical protein
MYESLTITRIDNGFLLKWWDPQKGHNALYYETAAEVISKAAELVDNAIPIRSTEATHET